MSKIVVGVDLSESSIRALDWIVARVAPREEIWLLHCLEVPRAGHVLWESLAPRDELVERLTRNATERLEGLCPGRRVQHVVREGTAGPELARLAEEIDADWIAVGEHAGPWSLRQVLGSTAERVLAQTDRPVLSVKGERVGPLRTVLVEMDDSRASFAALDMGLRLAREREARLVLHHAVTDWYQRKVREVSSDEEAEAVQARVEERAREWLVDVWRRQGDGADVRAIVSPGPPGFQALATIDRLEADLVVVGTHGLESLVGDPLRHVSRFLVLTSPCPVLVVPDGRVAVRRTSTG